MYFKAKLNQVCLCFVNHINSDPLAKNKAFYFANIISEYVSFWF